MRKLVINGELETLEWVIETIMKNVDMANEDHLNVLKQMQSQYFSMGGTNEPLLAK